MFRVLQAIVLSTVAVLSLCGPAQAQEPRLKVNPDGIGVQPRLGFNGYFRNDLYNASSGVWVRSVNRYSLADRVGLERGDIIISINGDRIRCDHDYHEALREALHYNGGHVKMVVEDVRVRLGYRAGPRFPALRFNLHD